MSQDFTDILVELSAAEVQFIVVEFEDAWADHLSSEIAGVNVPVLSRRAFIINKRSSGRLKDRADLESLGGV